MHFGVVRFPGSNCDQDMIDALGNILGHQVSVIWHKDRDLKGVDAVVLPGGFSYGDYLRSGAIARFSPVMEEVIRFAEQGGFVLGVCNGFQVLCESGLLPGALLANDNQRFICKNIELLVASFNSPITSELETEETYTIPIAHGEGRYFADAETIERLEDNGQILFRYANEEGEANEQTNPNGSVANIAGVCNEGRNVMGMMPHPERAVDPALGNEDGTPLLQSMITFMQEQTALS